MPSYRRRRFRPMSFQQTLATYVQSPGLPFHDALDEHVINRIAAEIQDEFDSTFGKVYTLAVVLWAFLTQVSAEDQSCRATVMRILAFRKRSAQPACSTLTGAYCKARRKLANRFLHRLVLHVGHQVEDEAPDAWRWKRRRAIFVDGTTVTAADTPSNQAAYPQPSSQEPGLGFPIIRLVVLLGLATGSLLDAAMGPYCGKETGETALLRTLLDELRPGDVLVADRYYCSYWMIALAQVTGVDVVFRLHQLRHYDFRRGRRLGADDHVVEWLKPQRPEWMDQETYDALPETLTIRELRTAVLEPGYRPKELVVATTMTDADAYSRDELLDLYHERWHVELDIEAIKQTLKMDILRCKTPHMLHNEIWAHLLAYNLIRKVMAQAAMAADINPRTISFKGTLQAVREFQQDLQTLGPDHLAELAMVLLKAVAQHRVANRPGRVEPRAVKRRPKEYDRLMQPRAQARAALLN
jgi:hypothetical protein